LIDLKEIKNKIITKKNLYSLCVISIIFFLDRYTKLLILNNFNENSYYLNNFLNLDLIWNIGIGFGLFSTESTIIYNLVTLLIGSVVGILIYFSLVSDNFDKLIYSIIIGGATGNLFDRLYYKAVPDFIDLHYDNFHWFTFNVADIFITIGILIFIMRGSFIKR